ncbi:MAG: hypothetical protein ACRCTA_04280, partial [Bacilli bacterium]
IKQLLSDDNISYVKVSSKSDAMLFQENEDLFIELNNIDNMLYTYMNPLSSNSKTAYEYVLNSRYQYNYKLEKINISNSLDNNLMDVTFFVTIICIAFIQISYLIVKDEYYMLNYFITAGVSNRKLVLSKILVSLYFIGVITLYIAFIYEISLNYLFLLLIVSTIYSTIGYSFAYLSRFKFFKIAYFISIIIVSLSSLTLIRLYFNNYALFSFFNELETYVYLLTFILVIFLSFLILLVLSRGLYSSYKKGEV